jgi:hypothetical protein
MSRVVHPEFEHGQRVESYRPNVVRRTISHYQLAELFVIIGIILMVWGALSLGRVSTALGQLPSGWVESVRLEILRRLDPHRQPNLSPGRLQYAGVGGARPMPARARAGGQGDQTARRVGRKRGARSAARPMRVSAGHGRNGSVQLWAAVRHPDRPWSGRRIDPDRRRIGRALCLRTDLLPAA